MPTSIAEQASLENPASGSLSSKLKMKEVEVEDDTEEEDSGVGIIRIRDICTLQEDDSDDDVIELSPSPPPVSTRAPTRMPTPPPPKPQPQPVPIPATPVVKHSPFVQFSSVQQCRMTLDLNCVEEATVECQKGKVEQPAAIRRKMEILTDFLRRLTSRTPGGLIIREKDKIVVSSQPSNVSNVSLAVSASTPVQNSTLVGMPRGMSTAVPRPRPHIFGVTSNQQTRPSSTIVPSNIRQVVYDPRSGYLLAPSTMPTTSQHGGIRQTIGLQPAQVLTLRPNVSASNGLQMSRPVMVTNAPLSSMMPQNTGLSRMPSTMTGVASSALPPPRQTPPVLPQLNTVQAPHRPMIPTRPSGMQPLRQMTYPSIAPKSSFPAPAVNQYPPSAASRTQPSIPAQTTAAPLRNLSVSTPMQPPAVAAPASASFIKKPDTPKVVASGSSAPAIPSVPEKNMNPSAKTFPSLVVLVKPYLQEKLTKTQTSDIRSQLDAKVKDILMQSPVKLTEWLIQQGLLKLDHKCVLHNNMFKLGMYSDSDKFPYSGGYVFTADCCTGSERELPVFQGSIFEASIYPPGTTMKLIYHWACQTPSHSVLTWVKVTSYYLKNFYTLLRSVCVATLHEHASKMGGKGKYIEVGVVTLGTMPTGTNTVPTSSRQTKVEILGIFDPGSKFIRMRLLNTPAGVPSEAAKRDRVDQILTPLNNWVNRDSVLLIDASLDKNVVESLGFKNVNQTKTSAGAPVKTSIPTNVNVMNYLKNIVPKMFQNTLCVLSKSLIQQFLDELSWRELYGPNPLKTFETCLLHMKEMTQVDTGEMLIPRLNRISLNPFEDWSYSGKSHAPPPPSGIECLPDSIISQPLSELVANAVGMDPAMSSFVNSYVGNSKPTSEETSQKSPTPVATPAPEKNAKPASKRKAEETNGLDLQGMLLDSPKTHTLQAYYYVYCPSSMEPYQQKFPTAVKCPLCSKSIKSNLEVLLHLVSHVLSAGRMTPCPHGCRYCLREFAAQNLLEQHLIHVHKRPTEDTLCRICFEKFSNQTLLIMHMWKRHVNCEAPYRCEVCEYRSSFHHDVVDHFYKEHGSSDIVQCPVCLKAMAARSVTTLKNVVAHLQNHVLRKGKKCQDCSLQFSSDIDYRTHLINDSAHDTRRSSNFVQHPVNDTPIRMPKPPVVPRDITVPPPPKKTKSSRFNANVQTLNTTFAVPLNPMDRYMFTSLKMKINEASFEDKILNCWECLQPIKKSLQTHFKGILKCSRCKYETCCAEAIQKHVRTHDSASVDSNSLKMKLAKTRKTELGSDVLECKHCSFITSSTRRCACHIANMNHKVCRTRTPQLSSEEDKRKS